MAASASTTSQVDTHVPTRSPVSEYSSATLSPTDSSLRLIKIGLSMWYPYNPPRNVNHNVSFAITHTLKEVICQGTDLMLVGPSSDANVCNRTNFEAQRRLQNSYSYVKNPPRRLNIKKHSNNSLTWTTYRAVYEVTAISESYKEQVMKSNPNLMTTSQLQAEALLAMQDVVQNVVNNSLLEGTFGKMVYELTRRDAYGSPSGEEVTVFSAITKQGWWKSNSSNTSYTSFNMTAWLASQTGSSSSLSTSTEIQSSNGPSNDSATSVNTSGNSTFIKNANSSSELPGLSAGISQQEKTKRSVLAKLGIAGLAILGVILMTATIMCIFPQRGSFFDHEDFDGPSERVVKPTQKLDSMILITPRGVDRLIHQHRARGSDFLEMESPRPGTPTHEQFTDVSLETPSPRFSNYSPRRSSPTGSQTSSSSGRGPRTPPHQPSLSSNSPRGPPYSYSSSSPRGQPYQSQPHREPNPLDTPPVTHTARITPPSSRQTPQGRRNAPKVPPADVFLTIAP